MTGSQQRPKKTRQPCKFSRLCLEINRDGRNDSRKAVRWEKQLLAERRVGHAETGADVLGEQFYGLAIGYGIGLR